MKFTKLSITLCATLVSLLWSSTAFAAAIKISLRANTTSGLYNYVQYNPHTCAAMMVPKFKVKSVENGKIVGSKGSFKLTKGPCKGRKMKGVAFRHTPKRGFRGTDKAAIQLTMSAYTDGSGNASRTLNFIIQVK